MTNDVAPGRLLDVDGVLVHVLVRGVPGGPVVVLESGLGGGVLEWESVAAGLADRATVVSRDRPGLGWSGQPRKEARTAVAAARDLKRLLDQLELAGPFVLVGHSLGGLHVRAFACLFPRDVAGVVLVDPSHEDAVRRIPTLRWLTRAHVAIFRALLSSGPVGRSLLLRLYCASLTSECAKPLTPATAEVLSATRDLARRPGALLAIGAEFAGLDATFQQIRELTESSPFPHVPLRVISQGRPRTSRPMKAMLARWQTLHAELLHLSPDSRHLVADRSGHLVPLEQPEIIVAAVRDVLAR